MHELLARLDDQLLSGHVKHSCWFDNSGLYFPIGQGIHSELNEE